MSWGFYGRSRELATLRAILERRRWFFARITGRRRIGKTTLVRHALMELGDGRPVFYVQIPDSAPAGILSSVTDALDTFEIDPAVVPRPTTLAMTPEAKRLVLGLDEGPAHQRRPTEQGSPGPPSGEQTPSKLVRVPLSSQRSPAAQW